MTADNRAVVARRTRSAPARTAEIEQLTEAAGYQVVASRSQVRPPDGGYNLGAGLAAEIGELVDSHDADCVVIDNELTPTQTWNLAELCPPDTQVFDRYRLVLEIFAEGTGDRTADLQVELARLEYDLPRVKHAVGQRDHGLSRFTEKGTPIQDLESRIERLRSELNDLEQSAADRRESRRAQGFDLVALAGYTNAGKSTLLHRLADDLSLTELEETHDDLSETAAVEDRLFRTVETTTRRATIGERKLLLTDTVGLLDTIPHELIQSFESTITAATDADLTLVVADAADESRTLRRKLNTVLDVLSDARQRLIVLNKIDKVDAGAVKDRIATVQSLTEAPVVPASATEGELTVLKNGIRDHLPEPESLAFELPQGGQTEAFLSWLHDRAVVESVEYTPQSVQVTARARSDVAERAQSQAPAPSQ